MGTTIPPTRKQPLFASPVVQVLVVIIVSLTLMLTGIIGYTLSARNYATHTGFLAQNGHLLKVIATRGKTIALGVEVQQENLGGLWASDQGVTLTLEGISTSLTVVDLHTRNRHQPAYPPARRHQPAHPPHLLPRQGNPSANLHHSPRQSRRTQQNLKPIPPQRSRTSCQQSAWCPDFISLCLNVSLYCKR